MNTMNYEGEEGTSPEQEEEGNLLQSVENDDSGSWPHSNPAYFSRSNLACRQKSRLGRRQTSMKYVPIRIDEGGQTSDNVCSEQSLGSTPFPQRSSGMAWLRETPTQSVDPNTPGSHTRDSVENAKSGYNPSYNFQRDNKSNTEVDPLSYHSALFSNTTEKSVHSLFNPTLGLKNIIFKNTPFKGSENEKNTLNNVNQQGKNSTQIKQDSNLRIKLFENSGDDKENISANLKPMDRKLIEISNNTNELLSEIKPSLNTDTPMDLSSGHSHSGNSSLSLEMNLTEGFNKIKIIDNNNDKVISNLPNRVDNKLHHATYPAAVLFRKPFDSIINKNYVLTPCSDKYTNHSQQNYDQKNLPKTDIQDTVKESCTANNDLSINRTTKVKTGGRSSDEFTSGSSDDSSKSFGPTVIKVGTEPVIVLSSDDKSTDIQKNLSTPQNASQYHVSNKLPTIFSHSGPNQSRLATRFQPYSKSSEQTANNKATSNPILLWNQKGPSVLDKNSSQFKIHNSYTNALKQLASKIELPSQNQSDNVPVKSELQNEINYTNMKEIQPLESVKTFSENFLNMNLNAHNKEACLSTTPCESSKKEVPDKSEAVNIVKQTCFDCPNYILVGECKPQYLSKQQRVMQYRSMQRPGNVSSHQSQSDTRQSPEEVRSQQSLPERQSVSLNEAATLTMNEFVNDMIENKLKLLRECNQAPSPVEEQNFVGDIVSPGETSSERSNTAVSHVLSPEYSQPANNNIVPSGDNMVFAKPAVPPPQKSRNILPTVKPKQSLPKTQVCSVATNVQNNVRYSVPKNAQLKQSRTLTVNGKSYTVLSMLGRGGSSEVYQVLDPKTVLMAVKCVDLSVVEPVIAEGYLNEIELLSKLQGCESVIRMFDHEYVKTNKMLYVVMEKGDTDLSKLIQDISKTKKIPISMVVHYWIEMLTAVKDIHDRGIIHSDLKPANFLLVSGRLKLIDFGIASSLQGDMTSVHKELTTGTWNYMSPEAFNNSGGNGRGIKITYKSDVWSLGCILYNLLYGKTPFSHIRGTWDKLIAIMDPNHKIDFPHIGVPVVLEDALKSCFNRDPKQRPSVTQLLEMPYFTNFDPEYLQKRFKMLSHNKFDPEYLKKNVSEFLQTILPTEYWNAMKHLFSEEQQEESETISQESNNNS